MIDLSQLINNSAALIVSSTVIVAGFVGAYRKALTVSRKLTAIHAELVPNGGSSLRDAINRIEALQVTSLAMTGKAHWISEASGACGFASPMLANLIGVSASQMLGFGWVSFIAPEYRDACRKEWDNAVRDKREFHMRYEYIKLDGSRIPVIGTAFPLTQAHTNNFYGMLGWAEVIEEKKP